MNKNYLITTGGSGGHVLPAVVLYEHLSKRTPWGFKLQLCWHLRFVIFLILEQSPKNHHYFGVSAFAKPSLQPRASKYSSFSLSPQHSKVNLGGWNSKGGLKPMDKATLATLLSSWIQASSKSPEAPPKWRTF